MAKKKTPAAITWPPQKLAGKTIAFVGKHNSYWIDRYYTRTREAGGTIVDPQTTEPDYLVVGEGRGGKPPGDVAKLQKRYPNLQALPLDDFFRMLIPDRDELLALIAADALRAPDNRSSTKWDPLEEMLRGANATIDLTGVDLRKTNLYAAKMERMPLDDADLRGAKMEYTHTGQLHRVNLDGIDGRNIYLPGAEDCTFRKANLEKAWMFWGAGKLFERCDFSGAKMARARFRNNGAMVRQCSFQRADMNGAELESTNFEACDFSKADLSEVLANRASFERANFSGAKLARADLRSAKLIGADLTNADLRDAVLGEADLTGAKVDGANFAGAVLTGTILKDVDTSRAKNFTPPVVRTAGPRLIEFAAVAGVPKQFTSSAEVDLGDEQFAKLQIDRTERGVSARSRHYRGKDDTHSWIAAPTFEKGMLNLADRWPNATLRLDTIQARGGRMPRAKLQELAVAAWSEVFGVEKSADDLRQDKEQQAEAARAEMLELITRIRKEGVSAWEAIDYRVRDRLKDLRTVDLSGVDLGGIHLEYKNLDGARFAGSSLVNAYLYNASLVGADFTEANLSSAHAYQANFKSACFAKAILNGVQFQKVNLTGANFRSADLTQANLEDANLTGADLTDAITTDVNFKGAQYDPTTKLPARFVAPPDMIWNGPPRAVVAAHAPGSLDFATFFANLGPKVEPERLHKVMAMLKKEKFRLFAEFSEQAVVGVVRSQSSDDLAYSCRLAADGAYFCGTQNLKPCGGLRGGLCKHLLVLIVGLTRSGDLDPATVDAWVEASRSRKATMDKAALGETFLRYQSAQNGEVDWRPTETVPEDYYAL